MTRGTVLRGWRRGRTSKSTERRQAVAREKTK